MHKMHKYRENIQYAFTIIAKKYDEIQYFCIFGKKFV